MILFRIMNYSICIFLFKIYISPSFKERHKQTYLYYIAGEWKYLAFKYLIEEFGLSANEKDIYGENSLY